MLKFRLIFIIFCGLFSLNIFANTIDKITLKGLQKYSQTAIKNYITLNVGDPFEKNKLKNLTKNLFSSGYFKDVQLYRDGNELIISLVERPWISEILISGNELIDKDNILTILESENISPNRSHNQEVFKKIVEEIESQYYLSGYYGVRVATEIEELDNNRVRLKIQIDEGKVSQIVSINIIGNTAYKQEDLLKLFQTKKESSAELFGNSNYVRAGLEGDLQTLQHFYLDRGYAKFRYVNRKVALSADLLGVYITLQIQEGDIYHFSEIQFAGYEKILTKKEIESLSLIKNKQIFSRRLLVETANNIRQKLQNKGYAFARVNPITRVNDESKEVYVRFQIDTGKRVYVRRIIFTGNNITLDNVIRREMRQFEGSLYIPTKVEKSKNKINRLGFFSQLNVQESIIDRQTVDLLVKVQEQRTGSFNFQVGYSTENGILYKFSISENNWLGRGNEVKLELNADDNNQTVAVSVKENHFFDNDISLLWNIAYNEKDGSDINDTSYLLNGLSTNLILGIPYSEDVKFSYGLGFSQEEIFCGSSFIICNDYINQEGQKNQSLFWHFTGSIDKRNRGYFPSQGSLNSFSTKISTPEIGLRYYTLDLINQLYQPLTKDQRNTLRLKTVISYIDGYGGDNIPFYQNLFTGGSQTVKGYNFGSLGPKYTTETAGIEGNKGGKLRTYFNLDAYVSLTEEDEFSQEPDSFKLNFFVNGGYSFDDVEHFNVNQIRYSFGSGILYLSPIGIISIYYALPYNEKEDDELEQFNFSISSQL